ncbi:MAG: heme-binding protein [Planctomycetota bacterium]|nr:heme-binding protein [Planctomycetota bacterium]
MKRTTLLCCSLLFGVLFFSLGGCSIIGIRTTAEPSYEVLVSEEGFEVRQYGPQLIAETFVQNVQHSMPKEDRDYRSSGNQGFRRLAGYIFGGNTSQEEIAMTAPVLQGERSEKIAMTAPVLQEERADGWWMAFVLPEGYTLESAPVPNDSQVNLREVPGERIATLRYSGRNSPEKMVKYEETLRAWLQTEGVEAVGAPRMASYDPPWALPFMRRNEVQIEVK